MQIHRGIGAELKWIDGGPAGGVSACDEAGKLKKEWGCRESHMKNKGTRKSVGGLYGFLGEKRTAGGRA